MPVSFQDLPNGQTARCVSVEKGENMEDLFAQAGYKTEDEVAARKKDLRMWITGMNKSFAEFGATTQWMFNPEILRNWHNEEGLAPEDDCVRGNAAIHWFRHAAMPELLYDLKSKRKQRIDGKDWSCGFLGSRWSDRVLAGVPVRVCFYSRKHNGDIMEQIDEQHKYVIMIDPHELDFFGKEPSADSEDEE
jgi:hypothetical protein